MIQLTEDGRDAGWVYTVQLTNLFLRIK
jgi:hypothetical protein